MSIKTQFAGCSSRRDFLRTGLFGMGVGLGMPLVFEHSSLAMAAQAFHGEKERHPERILVVVELAGGNDGLNTVVPYRDDAYYKARPTIAVKKSAVLKLSDDIGLHPSMSSMKRLWDNGRLALVQGCGYPNPNRSHFTSMEYWHTAVPNSVESRGWVGRLADERWNPPKPGLIVNVGQRQSLAVQSNLHAPIVFSDPDRFVRAGDPAQEIVYKQILSHGTASSNKTLSFLRDISKAADSSSAKVREAVANYKTPVPYGSESVASTLSTDLKKVSALINSGFPTRIYYVTMGGFDTHAGQAGAQQTLLMYVADALEGFLTDMKRIGRSQDVAMMMFTEFGRRVQENQSGGTDHGTATPMYILGENMKAGLYGKYPLLNDLDDNGDLKMTVDFRRVYSTMIQEWMGFDDAKVVLKGDFKPLGVFAT
jgi:uncharacterized protein (DUF1501 family)